MKPFAVTAEEKVLTAGDGARFRDSSRPVMSRPEWTRLERGRPRRKPRAGAGPERNPQRGRFWTYVRDDRPFGGLAGRRVLLFGRSWRRASRATFGELCRIDAGTPKTLLASSKLVTS